MKNGVNKNHMNHPSNIGPVFGQRVLIGPDIDAPGWGQKYSSPYQLPVTRPTWWNGPDHPDFTRGRHKYRTLPRGPGYVPPTDNPMSPDYAHGLGMIIRGYSGGCTSCGDYGAVDDKAKFPLLTAVVLGVLGYGLYRAYKGK